MELHVPALEALGYAEEFGFVGDRQDDGVRADFGSPGFACCMTAHGHRDADGKIGSDDDVVELDLGSGTAARIVLLVKRSRKSCTQLRHRIWERQGAQRSELGFRAFRHVGVEVFEVVRSKHSWPSRQTGTAL